MQKIYSIVILISLSLCLNAQVTISTNMPKSIAPNANIEIQIKINKGSIANFAKYQIDVPNGVTVTEGDSKTGNFTFESNRAKIVWVSIPSEPEFIVSMKLNTGTATGPAVFTHKFYFLDNGTKKEVEADAINVTFDGNGSTTASNLPAVTQTEPAVTKTETKTEPATTTTEPKTEPVVTKTEPKTEPVITKTEPITTKTETKTQSNTTSTNGLVYKVQLGSFGANPGTSKFAAIGGKVVISNEAGMYKALYGNYSTKDEALKKREELITKGFIGFVVAYQNGVRVK